MFFDVTIDDVNALAPYINEKVQSLLYYGIDRDELKRFVISNGLLGVDRIVPFGTALDIGVFWDGYDIIGQLSRRISF